MMSPSKAGLGLLGTVSVMVTTALIVEGDRERAELAASWVRTRGYKAILVASGEAALAAARVCPPEVLLIEERLPGTDGHEMCRRLRRDRRTRRVPIVMSSHALCPTICGAAYRVGANAYLSRPISEEGLVDAIEKARAWRHDLDSRKVLAEVHVELNSATGFLVEAVEFLIDLASETPLCRERLARLRQAVMETGQNAIEWGNDQEVEKVVKLIYRAHPDRIEIAVRDQGLGFDYRNIPHAASPHDPLAHMDVRERLGIREGGFGLLISRGMVDELRHNTTGNEVTLELRFHSTGTGFQ